MELNTILKLLDAGYTKADIEAMTAPAKEEAAPAAPTTKECPYCKSAIAIAATRCPHCTSLLEE